MTRIESQPEGGIGSTEKGATVHSMAECKQYATLLEGLPGFNFRTLRELESFVTTSAVKVWCRAGTPLAPTEGMDQHVYVMVSGAAVLDAGDVRVKLCPGDYFGGSPVARHGMEATPMAVSDVEMLVIDLNDARRLTHPSSGWDTAVTRQPLPQHRLPRRTPRLRVLVGAG